MHDFNHQNRITFTFRPGHCATPVRAAKRFRRGPSPMAATAELAKFTWKTMPTCGVSIEENALAPMIILYKFLLYSNWTWSLDTTTCSSCTTCTVGNTIWTHKISDRVPPYRAFDHKGSEPVRTSVQKLSNNWMTITPPWKEIPIGNHHF